MMSLCCLLLALVGGPVELCEEQEEAEIEGGIEGERFDACAAPAPPLPLDLVPKEWAKRQEAAATTHCM
jgi:hypothetical protein